MPSRTLTARRNAEAERHRRWYNDPEAVFRRVPKRNTPDNTPGLPAVTFEPPLPLFERVSDEVLFERDPVKHRAGFEAVFGFVPSAYDVSMARRARKAARNADRKAAQQAA